MHLNKLSVRLAGAALLLLAGAPAAADPAAVSEAEATMPAEHAAHAPAAAPAQPKKICRNIESSANRLGAKRVCMTAEEWRHVKLD